MNNSDMPITPVIDKYGFLNSVSSNVDYKSRMCGLTKLEYFIGLAMQGLIAEGRTSHKEIPAEAMEIAKGILFEIKYKDED